MVDLIKTVTELPIAEVQIGARLRDVSEAEVEALINLIGEFGQTTPILVRKKRNGFWLVDGMHRLEATRRCGMTTIPVRAYEMTDDDARLLEASQNLVGGMNALDDAVFLAAWKKAHLRKYPETAQGIAGALAKNGLQANSSSFAEIVAEKRGVTVRQVQKVIKAGLALGADHIAQLRTAKRPATIADLMEISKIGDPEERNMVVLRFASGNAKSAAEARRTLKAENAGVQPTIKDPVEEAVYDLVKLWNRAPKEAKRRFLQGVEPEVSRMIHEIVDAKIINAKLGKPADDPAGAAVLRAKFGGTDAA